MFHNYLVTALRNFSRHKLYSFINIAGLMIGLTCAIFIILFVRDELSYDRWIPGTENLYRVEVTFRAPGQPPFVWSVVPFPVPDTMLAQLPEVKAAAHLQHYDMTVTRDDRQFLEHVNVVSPNFFQIIKLPLAAGDRSALFARTGVRRDLRKRGSEIFRDQAGDWADAQGWRGLRIWRSRPYRVRDP